MGSQKIASLESTCVVSELHIFLVKASDIFTLGIFAAVYLKYMRTIQNLI